MVCPYGHERGYFVKEKMGKEYVSATKALGHTVNKGLSQQQSEKCRCYFLLNPCA